MKNGSYHKTYLEKNEAVGTAYSAREKKLLAEVITSGALPHLTQGKKNKRGLVKKNQLLQTLIHLDRALPFGLIAYLKEAKQLLKEAQTTKQQPSLSVSLSPPQNKIPLSLEALKKPEALQAFLVREKNGLKALSGLAVVLVAGGLGERLGAKELKLNLTANVFNKKTFLESYLDCLFALEQLYKKETGQALSIPLVLMTSPATHKRTVVALEKLSRKPRFEKVQNQITVVQQTMVPALKDLSGQLALEKEALVTKPPGHGEIHALMHRQGIVKKLKAQGKKWLFFVQDTNVQIMNVLLSGLGVLAGRPVGALDFAWLTVPRKPQESMGVVGEMRTGDSAEPVSTNLEYNLLSEAAVGAVGAEALKKYPGNTNSFFIRLTPYEKILRKTRGKLKYFVNPKFEADGVRFKKPCRLESLMQDISHHFHLEKVVVLESTREWSYAPLKNQAKEAVANLGSGVLLTPAAREENYFKAMRQRLRLSGNQFPKQSKSTKTTKAASKNAVPAARITPNAECQLSLRESRQQMQRCVFHEGALLVVEQTNLEFEAVTLDAGTALLIQGVPGTTLSAKQLRFSNKGYKEKKLSKTVLTTGRGREEFSAMELIAGKKITWVAPLRIKLPRAGKYVLLPAGKVKKLKQGTGSGVSS